MQRGFDAHLVKRCTQRGLKKLDYNAFFTSARRATNASGIAIDVDAFSLGVQKCDTDILQKLDFLQMPFEANNKYSTVCGSVTDQPVVSPQQASHGVMQCYVLSIYCY